MVLKLLLSSILLISLPMMALPLVVLKIPPLYVILLSLLWILTIFKALERGIAKKNTVIIIAILGFFFLINLLIGGSIVSVALFLIYVLILNSLKEGYGKTIFSSREKIDKMLLYVYIIVISIMAFQFLSYVLFGIVNVIDPQWYLTSSQYGTSLSPLSGWNREYRPSAFFSEPSFAGLFIALYVAYRQDRKLDIKFLLFNIIFLHFFGNRTGEAVLLLLLLYIFLERYIGKTASKNIFIASLVLAVLAFMYTYESINNFILIEGYDGSLRERVKLSSIGLNIWLEHPIFGIGLGNISEYISRNDLYYWKIANLTNLYIQLLAEVGIVGFIMCLLIITRIYTFSYSSVALIVSFFFVGGYSLIYMFIMPLFISNYKMEKYERFISK
jgi:O-antigen ligase